MSKWPEGKYRFNPDLCPDNTQWCHVPFDNPVRPLTHGVHAMCHRCKVAIWWDQVLKDASKVSGWRAKPVIREWP